MSKQEAIPQNVIDTLAQIRAKGKYNMFMRTDVTIEAVLIDHDAYYWLLENKKRYVEALEAMSAYITKKD